MTLFQKKTIYGCEKRGDGHLPYLTRFTIFECRWFSLKLHIFHRSDHDDLHDHPWDFWTFPIWKGYKEQVRLGGEPGSHSYSMVFPVKPFRLYYRPAEYTHRVLLHSRSGIAESLDGLQDPVARGSKAVTLVLSKKPRREWGFWRNGSWFPFQAYFTRFLC